MIEIKDKYNCCGCGACEQICPKHCITLNDDEEGFLYPAVDLKTCIDCKLCEKVCHELHPYSTREPEKVLAAINKDENIRMKSSSGGIFYVLAAKTINDGGVVFGARFDDNWQVVLDYAETLEDIVPFMGSKYVQARTDSAFRNAKVFLDQNRKVLFSGTPCQIAALNQYLRKDYENLTTVDFVCHGVPSPKVWGMYLNEIVSSVNNIKDVKFRNKSTGWKNFNFKLSYNDVSKSYCIVSHHRENPYMKVFLNDVILRPSCYDCKAKCGRSKSDITVADFWGIQEEIPIMDDDKGTGLVMINTGKGMNSLEWSSIVYKESSLDIASKYNQGLSPNTKIHPKRERFFANLNSTNSVIDLMEESVKPSFICRTRLLLHRIKGKLKSLVGGGHDISTLDLSTLELSSHDFCVKSINFRNKKEGWSNYGMQIEIN